MHPLVLRYSTLRLVRGLGVVYRWLFSSWRALVAGLAATALLIWLAGVFFSRYAAAWSNPWTVLSVYALLLFFVWAWRARRRVVVERFVDYTGEFEKEAPGLATLVVANLQALGELYSDVDEQRALPTKAGEHSGAINATIKVEDVSEILKGAVSAESRLSLGPVGIPVGAFLALLGRLVHGPRMVGSLHIDSESLTLTAVLAGAGKSQTWRVDRKIPSGSASKTELPGLGEMVEELAYRVFSEAVQGASVRWRATKAFSEGLQKYRHCLRTPKNRRLNLRQAQKMFIETRVEDETFNLSYYNLGVVAIELEEIDAARELFLRAIEVSPGRWESYYALALYEPDPRNVMRLCDRILSLKPVSAQAHNLKGVIQRRQGDLEGAIISRKKAVTLAWKELLRAEFRGEELSETEKRGVTQYLRNLAVAYTYKAEGSSDRQRERLFARAVSLLNLAASVDPSELDTYFESGKICEFWGRDSQAQHRFESAVRIEPRNLEVWSYVALMRARNNLKEDALYACERVLDRASEASDEALGRVADAYERLNDPQQAGHVRGMRKFLESLQRDNTADLEAERSQYQSIEFAWEAGQLCAELGRRYLNGSKIEEASEQFEAAIEKFEGKHSGEIRKHRLHLELARCLRQRKKWGEALSRAQTALRQDPLSLSAHYELAQVYFALEDLASATSGLQEALLWHPDDSGLHWMMGVCHWRIAQHQGKGEERKAELHRAARHLRQALELDSTVEGKARTHYWLGRLHLELAEHSQAVSHLRIVEAGKFGELLPALFLGEAYLRSAAYNECEEQFCGLIEKVRVRLKKGDSVSDAVDELSDDSFTVGLVLAWSYWGLCYSHALRDVKLEESLPRVDRAMRIAERLKEGVGRDRCLAGLAHCKGWILYKLGKVNEAISSLEESVSLLADPEAYLHLALACEHSVIRLPEAMPFMIDRARACCEHVQAMDVFGEYSQEVQHTLNRLEMFAEKSKAAAVAAVPPKAQAAGK